MIDLRRFIGSLRLVTSFAKMARHPPDKQSVFHHSWGTLGAEAVVREDFLLDLCRGKRVLHFGFVDAPFSKERIEKKQLLHQKIQAVATFLYGLDIDAPSLELYRKLTGDKQSAILDVTSPLPNAEFLAQSYDVILFPEVLEHLLHPAAALENLRQICRLNPGAHLCITTPNAYSVVGFFASLSGDELVHPDHYFFFSPATLKKLMVDTGFELTDLKLYSSKELLSSPGLTKHGLIAIGRPK